MQFTTPVPIETREPKIDHFSRIFLIGSCFVENIGEKLDYYKFQNFRNPFGILYHPHAIQNFFKRVQNRSVYTSNDVFHHNERWHCFESHSGLSHPDKEELLRKLNENQKKTYSYLEEAGHVIITLGTSWVYRNIDSNDLVANCHKLPQQNFSKEISSPKEIEALLNAIIALLKGINPGVKVIFTISPVRHIKEGMVENQRSKAHLIAATHAAVTANTETSCYFPAYEILLDELRDYRFFTEDMIHPNAVAIEYIWNQFNMAWLSTESKTTMQKIETIQKGLSHRPYYEGSKAHQLFLQSLQLKIKDLEKEYPHLEFSR